MKKIMLVFGLILMVFAVYGCEDDTVRYVEVDNPPAIPQGVYSVTGDNAVTIYWLEVQDADLDHYRVYWSDDDVDFTYMNSTTETYYVDTDVDNGTTYYYAVTAVDKAGNESELSRESVFDTPRPDGSATTAVMGYGVDFNLSDSLNCGYDFSAQSTDAPNDFADIFFDVVDGTIYINVANINTDIQDMGYTYDFDEIGYSPDLGWSQVGWFELLPNHTYIIWTDDNHFAKVRPTSVSSSLVSFQWAYQTDAGNPELARPQHDEEDYLGRTINGTILR